MGWNFQLSPFVLNVKEALCVTDKHENNIIIILMP